jgi:hypothetical protein
MDQKVHFMHARCNCLNTKVFGQMLGHKKKKTLKGLGFHYSWVVLKHNGHSLIGVCLP